MPGHLIKRLLPTPKKIRDLNLQYYLGNRVNDPVLWRVSRKSVSRATAIGLFCAYLPMPLEMLVAGLMAIFWRANLPLSVVLVWISNPFTWLILYTPPYMLGLAITGEIGITLSDITIEMMVQQFAALWIGCLIFGIALAVAGYVLANVIWRMLVFNRWARRRNKTFDQDNGGQ